MKLPHKYTVPVQMVLETGLSIMHFILIIITFVFREHALRQGTHLLLTRSVMYLALGLILMFLIVSKIGLWIVTFSIFYFKRYKEVGSLYVEESESRFYSLKKAFKKTTDSNLFIFTLTTLSLVSTVVCAVLCFLFLFYYVDIPLVSVTTIITAIVSAISIPLNIVILFQTCVIETVFTYPLIKKRPNVYMEHAPSEEKASTSLIINNDHVRYDTSNDENRDEIEEITSQP